MFAFYLKSKLPRFMELFQRTIVISLGKIPYYIFKKIKTVLTYI